VDGVGETADGWELEDLGTAVAAAAVVADKDIRVVAAGTEGIAAESAAQVGAVAERGKRVKVRGSKQGVG